MNRISKRLTAGLQTIVFLASEKGLVALEFALTLPIWLCLFFGTVDAAHLMLMSQRVDRIAYSASDIITQQETITIADLENICDSTQQLFLPFNFGADGRIIISSIFQETSQPPKIVWQYMDSSGANHCGTLARSSAYGLVGDIPSLGSLTLNDNDNVIITEVFLAYNPIFPGLGLFVPHDLYRVTFYKPRLSPLVTPPV